MNNNIYELVYKSGPHGDACTTYTVKFYKDITLREFIKLIINDKLQEWGDIHIQVKDPELAKLTYAAPNDQYTEIKISYHAGAIGCEYESRFDDIIWESYIDTSKHNWSNGGWGCMNYWIWLK